MKKKTILINELKENKHLLKYANINDENEYLGWVSNFNINFDNGSEMKLDLKCEEDLFLLFVLASSWSKTGPWENATFFAAYLKYEGKANHKLWQDYNFVINEIENRSKSASYILEKCSGVKPRKKVSFRKDFFDSIHILSNEWESIKTELEHSNNIADYNYFIEYLSSISGLGSGKNKMKIKILLILRELRCQKVYENIDGGLCCIPDNRAREAAEALGIKLPALSTMKSILKASKIIYDNFGDLYDIPLFAYYDLKEFENSRL